MTDVPGASPAARSAAAPNTAWALVAAPIVFAAGWAINGATIAAYSPRRQAISDLAAVDSPRRWAQFAVFLAYGALMAVGSPALRRTVVGRAWVLALVNGIGVIGVAFTPIHRSEGLDHLHGRASLVAYLSIAALPVVAAWGLVRSGRGLAAALSVAAGVGSILLLASAYGNDHVGLLQRSGTTLGSAWVLVTGAAVATGHLRRTEG